MTKFFLKFCSIATLIIFIQSPVLAAGIVFEIETRDATTGESLGTMEISVDGPHLKMKSLDSDSQQMEIEKIPEMTVVDEAASGLDASSASVNGSVSDDSSVVPNTNTSKNASDGELNYNANTEKLVMVNHKGQEYFEMDKESIATMKDNFGDVAEQMSEVSGMMQQAYEAALAQLDAQGLSPEELDAATKMLKSTFGVVSSPTTSGPATLEINNLGKDTINGRSVTGYELLRQGEKTTEVWVADLKVLGVGTEAQETIESYFNFFAEMSSSYDEMGFGSDGDFNFFETMNEIGGFPVFGQNFEGGEVNEEFSLESVTKKEEFPQDHFEPPAGYRLRTMGGFFQ